MALQAYPYAVEHDLGCLRVNQTHVRWQREELIVEYPPSLSADEARAVVRYCFESGQVPSRGFNGALRLDIRSWGGRVEAGGRHYTVTVVRDTARITPA